jgi:CheY-like chemotaxis protein
MCNPLILVVNDSPVANAVNCHIVRRLGYEVASVGDGAQAVASCLERPPLVVVMDIDMPVMDGLAAAAELNRLHAEEVLPYIAVVGTSASMSPERSARCLEAGMLETLAKPVTFDQLGSAIKSAVRLAQERRGQD